MGDHSVQILSPPSPCPIVGSASFTSPRRAAAWPPTKRGRRHRVRVTKKEEDGAAPCCEEVLIAMGLIGAQLADAAYMVLLMPALEKGLDPLFLITFFSLANGLFALPFSVKLERRVWPQKLSGRLALQFLLLALAGVTMFQALMLHGLKNTSPTIAATMPNLIPGFIFLMAACSRFESVDLSCCYTRAKIAGIMVCLGGAITMSILQSKASSSSDTQSSSEWALGCFCLLGAVLLVSGTTVLQAVIMIDFPAPITLCTVISLLGSLLTAIFQVLTQGGIAVGTHQVSLRTIVVLVVGGDLVSSVCMALQTWVLKKKGPVVVSMFNPTQTVGSAIFSAIFLGRVLKPGSIAGMVLLFCGLYVVLWAKKKETQTVSSAHEDLEKQPLLSPR